MHRPTRVLCYFSIDHSARICDLQCINWLGSIRLRPADAYNPYPQYTCVCKDVIVCVHLPMSSVCIEVCHDLCSKERRSTAEMFEDFVIGSGSGLGLHPRLERLFRIKYIELANLHNGCRHA
jgi:hypothetical protein